VPNEGVIKFSLDFHPGPAPSTEVIADVNRWRQRLFALKMIGQDSARYDGFGFGNVSVRGDDGFWITGTQTGGLEQLDTAHYVLVIGADTDSNAVTAVGPLKPSSEALTHAALYQAGVEVGCVLHVHAPELWRNAAELGLPLTDALVPYGTPQMSDEVTRLFRETAGMGQRLFAMGGHEDGLVAFGATPDVAGGAIEAALERLATL